MNRYSVLLLLSAALAGCASAPKASQIYVPVAVPCPVPAPVIRPVLPAPAPGDDYATLAKKNAAALELLSGYAHELETILDGYRHGR